MDNPWQVESLWAFAHLHCPECAFSTQEESFFQCHAIQSHPLSSVLFGTEIHEETFVKQAKLFNQVPSLSLSRWRTLTLLKI